MSEPDSPAVNDLPAEPAGSWSTLFHHARNPVFLLSRRGQIRYVNPAWETLTGKSAASVRGLACRPLKKKGTQPMRLLLQALAPPPEIGEGRTRIVRRPAPPAKAGPPWWDVTFVPIHTATDHVATIGLIHPIDVEAPRAGAPATGLSEALITLRQEAIARWSFDLLVSETSAMQQVDAKARLAAGLRCPVWINGETGTGKRTLARIIHFNGTTRDRSWLPIDAAGLQPFLIRTMLFGTPASTPGSVLLQHPHRLPADLQAEIVDWFEEQDDPPRVIVASSTTTGLIDRFRVAFGLLTIDLPPLRDRLGDLPEIIRQLPMGGPAVSPEALAMLRQHAWPGNIRELANVLRDAARTAGAGRIEVQHLPLVLRVPTPLLPQRPLPALDTVLEEVERRLITEALRLAKGNKADAAERLNVPRARLLRRIETLKIGEDTPS